MNIKTSTKDLGLTNNEKLAISDVSPFKPKNIKNLKPSYLKFFCFNSGFKKKNNDLLILIFDKIINVHCIYSLTSTPSAPIIWDKKNNKGKCKVLIVNSGNANAHTGNEGLALINNYIFEIKKLLDCKKEYVLVSSTGIIGELFNPNLIINSINKINKSSKTDLIGAAKSIMTTDTYPKTSVKLVKLNNKKIKIYGFAKGSGMIQPNMGTMLVYIFIECLLSKSELKKLIKINTEDTFNSISIDSDTSTSDTLMLFSISDNKINLKSKQNFSIISKALFNLMQDLSMQIVGDGEGVSKIIEVNVNNAKTKLQAKKIAFSIANSPLVKTAVAGEDANWGRVIMAIGKSYEKIVQNKIQVSFGNLNVCKKGKINENIKYKELDKYMKNKLIQINVNLGLGSFSKKVLGNDLTHKYIKINAEYRS